MSLPVDQELVKEIVRHITCTGTKIEGGLPDLMAEVHREVIKHAIERFDGHRENICAFLGMEKWDLIGRCRALHILPLLTASNH